MDLKNTLLTCIVSAFIAVIVRWAFKRYNRLKLLKRCGIPGPEPSFFSGNMYQLKSEPTSLGVMSSWLKQYGNVIGFYVGEVPQVVIKDLDILKQVMIKDFNSFTNRPDMFLEMKPLNQTLLAMKGKKWKEVRSILTPTFSSAKIKLMTQIVNKKVDITVGVVGKKAESGEMFDIHELVQGLTLDVIAHCALAMKTHCQENLKDSLLLAVRDFLRFANDRTVEYALMFPFVANIMQFVGKYMTSGQMLSFVVKHVESAVAERRKDPSIKSVDFLQLMLEYTEMEKDNSHTTFTDEEVVANACIFLLAGYDTTSAALAFTFYLLVTHPDVQERLHQEVQSVEDVDYTTIHSLQYLDQVFSESLRMYPPAMGSVTRECDRDYQIGSYTIPKSAIVQAAVWDIHHDPELWPDPWKFDPDRFAPENKASIKNMSYIPFGVGPRNCIGARFAQLEAKLALFRLVKKFRFEKCEKTDDPLQLVCATVIINPANGVYVQAVPRECSI